MDDQEFVVRMKEKIQRLTGKEVELVLGGPEDEQVSVDLGGPIPKVVVTPLVLKAPGLARMSIEYAVASIKKGEEVSPLEFYMILRRN